MDFGGGERTARALRDWGVSLVENAEKGREGNSASVANVAGGEKALAASFTPKAVEGITVPVDTMLSDIHAGSEYRAHLIGVMVRRAVEACA